MNPAYPVFKKALIILAILLLLFAFWWGGFGGGRIFIPMFFDPGYGEDSTHEVNNFSH